MTKADAFDSIAEKFNAFFTSSQTADSATWDSLDEDFKDDLQELLEAAGGNPDGKPRRR